MTHKGGFWVAKGKKKQFIYWWFFFPPLNFLSRLWRKGPASPKSSTSRRTVSANGFCVRSSSSGKAPERTHSRQPKAFSCKDAHAVGLRTSAAATDTAEGRQGSKVHVHTPLEQPSKRNSPFIFPGRGYQDLPLAAYHWKSVGRLVWTACIMCLEASSDGNIPTQLSRSSFFFFFFWFEKITVLFFALTWKMIGFTAWSLLPFLQNARYRVTVSHLTVCEPHRRVPWDDPDTDSTWAGAQNDGRTHSTFLQKVQGWESFGRSFLNACADERMQSAEGWKTVPEDARTSVQHLLPAAAEQQDGEMPPLGGKKTNKKKKQSLWFQPHTCFTNSSFFKKKQSLVHPSNAVYLGRNEPLPFTAVSAISWVFSNVPIIKKEEPL